MLTLRILSLVTAFVVAGYVPPAVAEPSKSQTVKTAMFGNVTLDTGTIYLADGGIHGVQGHTLVVAASGDARWERRLDGLQPSGKAGVGTLKLAADEAKQLVAWADRLWDLAPKGKASFDPDPKNGPPRWVWVIVIRRGDEVRILQGGDMASPNGAPDPAKAALTWLSNRVDAAAK